MDPLTTKYLIFAMNPTDLSKYLSVEGAAREDVANDTYRDFINRYPQSTVRLYTSQKELLQEHVPAT